MGKGALFPVLVVLLLSAMPLASANPVASSNQVYKGTPPEVHLPPPNEQGLAVTPGAFSFVSNFEDLQLDGWIPVSGITPSVTKAVTYSGEPALVSTAGPVTPQIDIAKQGFIAGDSFVSFQVAVAAGEGSGVFGLGKQGTPVAVVGVSNGNVVAGGSVGSLQVIEPVPTGTAYPAGWVYLTANVTDSGGQWEMNVFVDGTLTTAATLVVPAASSYTDAIIETTSHSVLYTDIAVATTTIPIYIPGYNNMDGYGQGSGLVVHLLPAFDFLTAEMTLNSWTIPQRGILSFQINAMNFVGTTYSTCEGFFQLGLDLDPGGTIAPWYVPGVGCVAHYFNTKMLTPTPSGSKLFLSIYDNVASSIINFTIIDTTNGDVFTTSIPYTGSLFYGAYTQVEFQPCCNSYPIQDYQFSGSLTNLAVTLPDGKAAGLPASYMIPFVLDTPPGWDFTYYQSSSYGYGQVT
jgi:hypothetical protein